MLALAVLTFALAAVVSVGVMRLTAPSRGGAGRHAAVVPPWRRAVPAVLPLLVATAVVLPWAVDTSDTEPTRQDLGPTPTRTPSGSATPSPSPSATPSTTAPVASPAPAAPTSAGSSAEPEPEPGPGPTAEPEPAPTAEPPRPKPSRPRGATTPPTRPSPKP